MFTILLTILALIGEDSDFIEMKRFELPILGIILDVFSLFNYLLITWIFNLN